MSEDKLEFLPIESIRVNKESLRVVDPNNPQFIELVNNVKQEGILLPINVTPNVDPETKEAFYGLVDGLQRLSAAKMAGLETIPAFIKSADAMQVLRRQVMANAIKVDTKPVEYSKQLQRLIASDPLMSVASMAASLGKSDSWVKERLNLTNLVPDAARLVDEGIINITSAFALAKLPPEEQPDFIQQARELPHNEFAPLCVARKKALDKARREGRASAGSDFEPVAHLQKISDIKSELENGSNASTLIANARVTSAEDGFKLALQWCLHLDPLSIAEAKVKHDEKEKNAQEKKKAAEIEREKKKLEQANLKAERSKLVLEVTQANGDVQAALKEFDAKHGLTKNN